MHGFQNTLAQLFISVPLQSKGVLMLYPWRPFAHLQACQVRMEF